MNHPPSDNPDENDGGADDAEENGAGDNSGADDDDDDDNESHDSHRGPLPAGEAPPPCLTFDADYVAPLAKLFSEYPAYITVKSLPIASPDDKLGFVLGLLSENLIEMK